MVQLVRFDLQFVLDQILLAESGQLPPTAFHPWGLRTVNGTFNHIIPGQELWGSADQNFPRLLTPVWRGADPVSFGGLPGQPFGTPTSYLQTSGFVFDTSIRLISNLIVDQTANNPAAVEANGGNPMVVSPGLDGIFGTGDDRDVFFIPNIAPDEGLSAPFNSWFTLFGQFFDHGLDLVNKGGSGTVVMPLLPDDPLYDFGADGIVSSDDGFGADGISGNADDSPNFMMLTRATNGRGPDGILGTADDVREHNNQTTPFIDQNQTYTSHASHQVFLREYATNGAGNAVSTGRFLDGSHGGLATWADIKTQAANMLGVLLSDHDVHNVPLLLTDAYGRFIPGANGFAQIGVRVGNGADGIVGTADDTIVFVEGVAGGLDINDPAQVAAALAAAGSSFTSGSVVRINHAFLDDIAHGANPGTFDNDGNPATPRVNQTGDLDTDVGNNDGDPGTFDDELLDAHFITGDGRGNENIGLTAVHTIFHAEHNRLVQAIKDEVSAVLATDGDSAFVRGWVLNGADLSDGIQDAEWNGERLFQAARVFTEMQYQHLVFEEFARKVQPGIDIFINIDMSINPAIFAEFAHVVYRFGHSMLTETVDRFDENFNLVNGDTQQIGLIAAFLNPVEFVNSGVDAADATAAIVRGMTRQQGNAIDEFITEALRNNLVGLPLDLAALNLARGRDTGIPGLNEARRQFYAATGDAQLTPYTSWIDFAQNVKHPASVINFIAAYGTHALITAETTMEGRRGAATAIATGLDVTLSDGRVIAAPTDALDFLNATGAYAGGSLGGLEGVDLWIGGLAELPPAFGGMLGSTFAFVFETQMEMLQNGDRFYYLARFSGRNFLAELEGNSFASLIMRNTDLRHLPGDVFATPDWTLEIDRTLQFTGLGIDGRADPTYADEGVAGNPFVPLVVRNNPATPGPDSNYLRYNGGGHVVLGGTDNADILIAGIGDDTIWGDGGNDRIEGGNGFDILNGGDGDDIITDSNFDGNIKGGDGNDVIHAGDGIDLVIAGRGNDFVNLGTGEGDEVFGGLGNDFLTGDGTLTGLVGGFGDDWIESAFGIGGLTGDNADVDGSALNFAGEDINGGHDVLIGGGAPNDFDSFGGDDIMVSGLGTDRLEGFIGFDWVSYQNNTQFGASADMFIRVFGQPPLPGDPGATLDRFDMVEGMSGSQLNDVLRGDDRNADANLTEPELVLTGHELNAAGIARIAGLADLLGAAGLRDDDNNPLTAPIAFFTGGNIILGGGGSDIMEGRGGNDVIDGDAYLHVEIGVDRNNDGDFNDANERAAGMDQLQAEMLAGTLNPGQLGIVREIRYSSTPDVDTAVYAGNRADYFIEGQDTAEGISDQDGDGFIRVTHLVDLPIPGRAANDGSDLLRNVERLQFNDAVIQLGDTPNLGPVGLPTIDNQNPQEDVTLLTADVSGVTDPNNTATGGALTGPVSITWQMQDGESGLWSDIMVLGGANGNEGPVPATGPTFTPGQAQAGFAIRVRVNYVDQNGVLETVFSDPTNSVIATNDAPVGVVLISDPTPTQGDLLTAQVNFIDPDGTDGAVFAFQWQSSADGGVTWTDIIGATGQQFQPDGTHVNLRLRAVVTYTDDAGFNERVESAMTEPTGIFISGLNTGQTSTGTAFADRILGNGGNDTLNGLAGADVLDGGANNDTLNGGAGNDILLGGAGTDTLNGDADNDTLTGGAGNDIINGGAGNDTIIYNFGDGADTMDGNGGTDTLSIVGTAGQDTLDVVFNGTRLTTVEGGSLANIEVVNANLQGDNDTLSYAATAAAVAIAVNLSTGTASGFNTILNIENVTGGLGGDSITGSGGANVLTGLAGADTIDGALGDDTFVATVNDGNDAYIGGQGFDIYNLSATSAAAFVNLSLGTSTSAQTGNDTLSQVEGVIGSAAADTLTGDGNANYLDGGGANDTINGGGGADTLTGGAGADTIDGGDGDDTIIYTFGDGVDVLYNGGIGNDTLRINGTAGANTLTSTWDGARLTSFNGTALQNIEAVRADLLDGSDRLSYAGTLAAFGVTVNLATNTATGYASIANIENVTGGAGADSITGNDNANDLDGGNGADTLDGGAGDDNLGGGGANDVLIGGLGNDVMAGGGGLDTFVFSGAFGSDTISDFDENPTGGQDLLDISAFGVTAATFASLVNIAQVGANVVITINGQTITLLGETAANITSADFIL